MTNTPLKPCPFCGSEVTLELRELKNIAVIKCPENSGCMETGLGTYIAKDMLESGIRGWNTRAIDAENVRLKEALKRVDITLEEIRTNAANPKNNSGYSEGVKIGSDASFTAANKIINTALKELE